MDRNTTIGLILIGLLLTVFTVVNQPSKEDVEKAKKEQAAKEKSKAKEISPAKNVATNKTDKKGSNKSVDKPKENGSSNVIAPKQEIKATQVNLENDHLTVVLNSKGANVEAVYLKKFRSYDDFDKKKSESLCLFKAEDAANFIVIPGVINTKNLTFKVNETHIRNNTEFSYRQGKKLIVVSYSIKDDYRLAYNLQLEGFSKLEMDKVRLKWAMNFRRTERKLKEQRRITTVCFEQKNDGLDYLSETSDDFSEASDDIEWVAFKQSYFSAILHPDNGFRKEDGRFNIKNFGEGSKREFTNIKEMTTVLAPNFEQNNASFTWYFGPNDYNQLRSYDHGYDDILNYGWGLFRWINLYAVQPIFNLLISNGIGAGLAILLLTLILKLILMPIQWKMFVSSVKMRILKPQVEELNKKYPDQSDALKKQSEMMALYKESGASPLAGCVPMLIQMPILLAVFRFFPAAFELRQQGFLWAEDLSSYDSIWDFGFNLWPYGDHMSLFTLLMAATTLVYTYMNSGNMQQPTQPGMPDMKVMMYIFPVLMIFFFNDYSSGLSYYYFISTLFSILLMVAIKKFFVNEEKLKVKMMERQAKAEKTPKKKSKFQERLEEMQRKSIEMQKNNKKK
jgi:YidC/Oxa1 family membrane protein insertase